jgi:Uri superfamily endonuclease
LNIEAGPGTYALCLCLEQAVRVRVGKTGTFDFCAGGYIYTGSAQGAGGVRARFKHHLRLSDNPHWHLDWLRPYARIIQGYFVLGEERLECTWSKALAELPGSSVPAAGFGASDCENGCQAHLVYFENGIRFEQVRFALQSISNYEVRELSSANLAILDYDKK